MRPSERCMWHTPSNSIGRPPNLTRERALAVLDGLVTAGSDAMAGRTLAYGRACYRWALRRGDVAANPFDGLPIATGTVSRDRVLDDEEVALIWKHAAQLGAPFDALFQILLLTAQRRAEVGDMRWAELSADRIRVHQGQTAAGCCHG
jgi:integrase